MTDTPFPPDASTDAAPNTAPDTAPDMPKNSLPHSLAETGMARLLALMARLRDPDGGCPWDLEQSFETIAPYTIEEAYEVDQAIRDGDRQQLLSELGDLLFQSVFHARLAEEEGSFSFSDVVENLCDKMIARHPHVFARTSIETAEAQTIAWEHHKEKERHQKARQEGRIASVLDDVPKALPALMRAEKLQKRAARIGFDWPDILPVLKKIEEEAQELVDAYRNGTKEDIAEEYGDLLFVMVNLGRHLTLDPETSLRNANEKFYTRFKQVEKRSKQENVTGNVEEMNKIWDQVKKLEKAERAERAERAEKNFQD